MKAKILNEHGFVLFSEDEEEDKILEKLYKRKEITFKVKSCFENKKTGRKEVLLFNDIALEIKSTEKKSKFEEKIDG